MTKKPVVYAFIDSQNLNLGVQSQANHNFSKLLRDYLKYIVQINKLRGSLEYKKRQPMRSVETLGKAGKTSRSSGRFETLGLPKHGDTLSVAKKSKKVNNRK